MGMGESVTSGITSVLPRLAELNPRAPDYVTKLEQGLATAKELYESQRRGHWISSSRLLKAQCAELQTIDGVVITEEFSFDGDVRTSENEAVGEGHFRSYNVDVPREDIAARRRVEDSLTNYRRRFEDEGRLFEDTITAARRAYQDFHHALLNCTELRPVGDIKVDATTSHLYYIVVRTGEVYEAHVDHGDAGGDAYTAIEGPGSNPGLTAKMFEPHHLEELRSRLADTSANVYIIAHPSTVLTVNEIFEMGYARMAEAVREKKAALLDGQSPAETVGATVLAAVRRVGKRS